MELEDIKELVIVGVDPVTAAMDAAYGFDMEQQEALRDMFQAFYDTLQETQIKNRNKNNMKNKNNET